MFLSDYFLFELSFDKSIAGAPFAIQTQTATNSLVKA